MQAQMMQNPELMQQMMNSPMCVNADDVLLEAQTYHRMDALMSNPAVLESMMMSNPAVQQLAQQHPELRQVLSDPQLMRERQGQCGGVMCV